MDPITVAYYALVCGALGATAPRLGRFPVRLATGVLVGIVAATALPPLRGGLGF